MYDENLEFTQVTNILVYVGLKMSCLGLTQIKQLTHEACFLDEAASQAKSLVVLKILKRKDRKSENQSSINSGNL